MEETLSLLALLALKDEDVQQQCWWSNARGGDCQHCLVWVLNGGTTVVRSTFHHVSAHEAEDIQKGAPVVDGNEQTLHTGVIMNGLPFKSAT